MSKSAVINAIRDSVRLFIDQEVPTVATWNIDVNKLKDSLTQIGVYFDDLDAVDAAMAALFDADHDNITGANPTSSEWLSDGATPVFISSSKLRLPGNRTADYAVANRIRASLGAPQVIVAITAVAYDGVNTTLTVTPTVLTGALTAVARGLVRNSMPQVQLTDLTFDPATQVELDAAIAIINAAIAARVLKAGDTMTGALVLPGSPVSALQAAPKQYVDLRVLKAGDTMTGPLVLPADPVAALQASTKQYVDLLYGAVTVVVASTPADTNPHDLQTLVLPAGYLSAAGKSILIRAVGHTLNNNNLKRIHLTFGADVITATLAGSGIALNDTSWEFEVVVSRRTGGAPHISGHFVSTDSAIAPFYFQRFVGVSDLSTAITIALEGKNLVANAGDIVADSLMWRPIALG